VKENLKWSRNVVNNNPIPSGCFLHSIAVAFLNADFKNAFILNNALTELREKYPTWDVEEN